MCRNTLREGDREQSQALSRVPSDRDRGKEHKLGHRRLLLNFRKHFVTVRVTKYSNRLSPHPVRFSKGTWAQTACFTWSCLDRGLG